MACMQESAFLNTEIQSGMSSVWPAGCLRARQAAVHSPSGDRLPLAMIVAKRIKKMRPMMLDDGETFRHRPQLHMQNSTTT